MEECTGPVARAALENSFAIFVWSDKQKLRAREQVMVVESEVEKCTFGRLTSIISISFSRLVGWTDSVRLVGWLPESQ